MSDAKAISEQNALEAISFLIGQWSVEVRYSISAPVNGTQFTLLPKPGGRGHATFQRTNAKTISGEYRVSEWSPDQSQAIIESRLQLKTDPQQETLVCMFAGNAPSPSAKGIPR